jgi:hypothetical protein
MKKLMAIAALTLLFVSCKKEYTCSCTIKDGSTTTTQDNKYPKQKKKDAEATCAAQDTSVKLVYDASSSCALK